MCIGKDLRRRWFKQSASGWQDYARFCCAIIAETTASAKKAHDELREFDSNGQLLLVDHSLQYLEARSNSALRSFAFVSLANKQYLQSQKVGFNSHFYRLQ